MRTVRPRTTDLLSHSRLLLLLVGPCAHWCSYNRRREDFDSDSAWNDYLEEVEDIGAPSGSSAWRPLSLFSASPLSPS